MSQPDGKFKNICSKAYLKDTKQTEEHSGFQLNLWLMETVPVTDQQHGLLIWKLLQNDICFTFNRTCLTPKGNKIWFCMCVGQYLGEIFIPVASLEST